MRAISPNVPPGSKRCHRRAPATDDRRGGHAGEDDAEVRRVRTVVHDRLVRLERRDPRSLDELPQPLVGEVREQPDVTLQEGGDLRVRFHSTCP